MGSEWIIGRSGGSGGMVAGCRECGEEPSGYSAAELVFKYVKYV
jgi:hypothetical protein